MSSVEIRKVESKRDLKKFIDLHHDLYQGNPYDAPNLYQDEVNTLSKDKNAAFDFCEAEYYLAYKDGKAVGRVAAIINHKANEKWQRKSVRFGWIDFIDDKAVSSALLKAVEDYGKAKGMTEIVGPLALQIWTRRVCLHGGSTNWAPCPLSTIMNTTLAISKKWAVLR